ncbi:MAG: hypothetical protein AABO57_27605 [Acidobacteriota bacterium]
MSSTVPLKARLTGIMKSWGIPINPGCQQALQQLIDQAVVKFQTAGFSSNSQKLNEAERNFEKLLIEMTWEAGQQGFKELHETTLSAALARVCPLFPFC